MFSTLKICINVLQIKSHEHPHEIQLGVEYGNEISCLLFRLQSVSLSSLFNVWIICKNNDFSIQIWAVIIINICFKIFKASVTSCPFHPTYLCLQNLKCPCAFHLHNCNHKMLSLDIVVLLINGDANDFFHDIAPCAPRFSKSNQQLYVRKRWFLAKHSKSCNSTYNQNQRIEKFPIKLQNSDDERRWKLKCVRLHHTEPFCKMINVIDIGRFNHLSFPHRFCAKARVTHHTPNHQVINQAILIFSHENRFFVGLWYFYNFYCDWWLVQKILSYNIGSDICHQQRLQLLLQINWNYYMYVFQFCENFLVLTEKSTVGHSKSHTRCKE